MDDSTREVPAQSVRFSDVNEEIEPAEAVQHAAALTGADQHPNQPLSPEAKEDLRSLSEAIQQDRCQARRMENFSFEPVSLPPSRVSKMPHRGPLAL